MLGTQVNGGTVIAWQPTGTLGAGYALVFRPTADGGDYVTAWMRPDFRNASGALAWGAGHYFDDFRIAVRDWESR